MSDLSGSEMRILVSSDDLERGFRDGYARYAADYGPARLPADTEISDFLLTHICKATGTLVYWAGFCLGWCAALLTHIMFISLPVQKRRRRGAR